MLEMEGALMTKRLVLLLRIDPHGTDLKTDHTGSSEAWRKESQKSPIADAMVVVAVAAVAAAGQPANRTGWFLFRTRTGPSSLWIAQHPGPETTETGPEMWEIAGEFGRRLLLLPWGDPSTVLRTVLGKYPRSGETSEREPQE